MLALRFDGQHAFLDAEMPPPTPADGEALIRIIQAGVCKTDLEILKGYMGFTGTLGHEFVGEVIDGPAELIGRRVVGDINCPSPACIGRPDDMTHHDPDRTVLGIVGRDGCFAECCTLPAANLTVVPDSVTDDQAVFAEPLAAAMQILEQVDVSDMDSAVVLGDGRLGLLCAMVLHTAIPNVTLVGKHAEKLTLAEKRGIRTALADGAGAPPANPKNIFTPAKDAPLVVEATGGVAGFELAMQTVAPRGVMVLKSTFATDSGLNLAPLVIDEITLIGSRCGPVDKAMDMMASGQIDPSDLISARFLLADGLTALKAAENELKVIIST